MNASGHGSHAVIEGVTHGHLIFGDAERTGFEQGDDLFLATFGLFEIDKAVGERFVVFDHEQTPDQKEVEPLEDDTVFFAIFGDAALKVRRHIGPVACGTHVVADVVAVIEALLVVTGVDARDGISVAVAWICGVNKGVLPPVSSHHAKARDHKGDDKDDQRRAPVVDAQPDGEDIESDFSGEHAA